MTGGCACGAVRYEVSESPLSSSYCHCTRCQRRTGTAASAQARFAPDALRITAGEEHVRTWQPVDGAAKCFCGLCGSALWSRMPTGEWGVRLGSFDEDPGIRPQWRQFVAYAATWEEIPEDGLPRHPERPS